MFYILRSAVARFHFFVEFAVFLLKIAADFAGVEILFFFCLRHPAGDHLFHHLLRRLFFDFAAAHVFQHDMRRLAGIFAADVVMVPKHGEENNFDVR